MDTIHIPFFSIQAEDMLPRALSLPSAEKISRVSQTREISITGSWAERKVHFLQFHRGTGGAYTSTKAHSWESDAALSDVRVYLLKDLQAKSTAPMRVCKLRPEQLNHLGKVAKDGQSS